MHLPPHHVMGIRARNGQITGQYYVCQFETIFQGNVQSGVKMSVYKVDYDTVVLGCEDLKQR